MAGVLTLSYIDPEYFLGGAMRLDAMAAKNAVSTQIGAPLRLSTEAAAEAIMQLATEHMARATEEITVNQGIDPRNAVLVCGGGAAGLNAVAIARRLGCQLILIPNTAAALSAAGALMSDLSAEYEATLLSKSTSFNFSAVNALLDGLKARCDTFIAGPGTGSITHHVEFSVEARYPNQNWELPVPLRVERFDTVDQLEQLRRDFHRHHEERFGIADLESEIEVVSFRARVSCRLHEEGVRALRNNAREHELAPSRKVYFAGTGWIDARVLAQERITAGEPIAGPAIIESPVTSVVIDSGCTVERRNSGTLVVLPWGMSRASDAHMLAKFEVGHR